jgi:hypothetical protein
MYAIEPGTRLQNVNSNRIIRYFSRLAVLLYEDDWEQTALQLPPNKEVIRLRVPQIKGHTKVTVSPSTKLGCHLRSLPHQV